MSAKIVRPSPLIEAYLDDLRAATADRDPMEREETLRSIQAHLSEALSEDSSREEITAVLQTLGDPAEIARAMAPANPADEAQVEGAGDSTSVYILIASLLAAVLVVPVPFVAVPLSVGLAVLSIIRLRKARRGRALIWTSLVISLAIVVAALLFFAFAVPAGDTVSPAGQATLIE